MKRNYLVLLVLMLIPVLILTACGGGETTAPKTTAAQTTPPTTSTPTATETPTTTPSPTTATATATQTPSETPEPTPTETLEPTETPEPTPTEPLDEVPPPEPVVFTLVSSAFENGEPIPTTYSYYGGNKSPPLSWSGAPEGTVSFALIMEDPDAPGNIFTHWIVYNIPADVLELAEGLPMMPTLANGASQGMNDFGGLGYGGPAPPSGTHRFYFRLYALDTTLDLAPGALKYQVVNAMQDHIIGEVELMGTFSV